MLPSSSNLDSEGDVFLRKEGGRGGIARLGCLLAPVDFDVTHTWFAAGGILLTACCFFCTLYVGIYSCCGVVCGVCGEEEGEGSCDEWDSSFTGGVGCSLHSLREVFRNYDARLLSHIKNYTV